MDDRYPFNKRWVQPQDARGDEHSEEHGYESSAVMDEEDSEDN